MQAANTNDMANAIEQYHGALTTFRDVMGRLPDGRNQFQLPENLPSNHLELISHCLLVSATASMDEDVLANKDIQGIKILATSLLLASTILGDALVDANIIHGKNQIDAYSEVDESSEDKLAFPALQIAEGNGTDMGAYTQAHPDTEDSDVTYLDSDATYFDSDMLSSDTQYSMYTDSEDEEHEVDVPPPSPPQHFLALSSKIPLEMSQEYLPKILEPGLLFQNNTKTLKDFIAFFKDLHQQLGTVVTNLDELEENHSSSHLHRLYTLLQPHEFYKLSVGLLRLMKAGASLKRVFLKDAPGFKASESLLRDVDVNLTVLLGSHMNKLQKAEKALEKGEYTLQVRMAQSFLDAMFPDYALPPGKKAKFTSVNDPAAYTANSKGRYVMDTPIPFSLLNKADNECDKENKNKKDLVGNNDTSLSFKQDRIRASLDARELELMKDYYKGPSTFADDVSVKKESYSPDLNEIAAGNSKIQAIEISSNGPNPLLDLTPLVFEDNAFSLDGTYTISSSGSRVLSGGSCVPSDCPRVSSGSRRVPSDRPRAPSGSRRVPSDHSRAPSGSTRIPSGKTHHNTKPVSAASNTPTASTSAMPLDGSPIEIPDSEEERAHKRSKTGSNK